MKHPPFRWRTLAVLLLFLPGCVQLTGQRITWFYDQAKDELQILLHYDGIHDSGNDASGKGTEQIPQFVREGNVMLLDWPFQLDMAAVRKKAEASGTWSLEKDWAQLVLTLKTEALGYYREPDGRVGAVQRVTVPRASEFLAKANRLISRQVLESSPLAGGTMTRTVERICAAARKGHAWIRLDGQSIRIDVPVHPDEWAGFKVERLHAAAKYVATALAPKATAEEKAAYLWSLQGLTSAPISYRERDDRVEFILGRAKTPSTWRFQIRSDYQPSLEKVVAESVKADVRPDGSRRPAPSERRALRLGSRPARLGPAGGARSSVDVACRRRRRRAEDGGGRAVGRLGPAMERGARRSAGALDGRRIVRPRGLEEVVRFHAPVSRVHRAGIVEADAGGREEVMARVRDTLSGYCPVRRS